jgi:citrate lyase subunit beta / citryl-CoA lyase
MSPRSYLFVPADRPERYEKALATGAHAVIIDLEDAVTPDRKSQARAALSEWLAGTSRAVYVRINPAGTPWHEQDCAVLAHKSVRGVMLPKAENAESVALVAAELTAQQDLIPLIETVAGWFEVDALAQVPRVKRLAFGSFDFMSDSGIQGDGPELDAVRTQLVLVSRRRGLTAPIDGVSTAIDDPVQLESDVRRSRRYGFAAKLCIHPKQVPIVHAGFAPRAEEVAWARRVIDALASGPLGAIAVDGKLVDRPVALMAEAIVQEASGPGTH